MDIAAINSSNHGAPQVSVPDFGLLKLGHTDGPRRSLDPDFTATPDDPNNGHFKDLEQWVGQLNKTLPAILAKRPTYDRVLALFIHWEHPDQAAENFPQKIDELQKVFRDRFNFETQDPFPIPNDSSGLALNHKLFGDALKISHKTKQNLFIIYYGGHGVQNKNGKCFWTPKARVVKDSPLVECSKFQETLSEADCDVLFLFDCCFATAMIDEGHSWKRRCEILGASGPQNKASGEIDSSFTTALAEELKLQSDGISVLQLYANISGKKKMKDYGLVTVPAYRKFWESHDLASISLRSPRPEDTTLALTTNKLAALDQDMMDMDDNVSTSGSSDTLVDLKNSTEARVLFSVAFLNPGERPTLKEFQQWLEYRPHNIKDIKVTVQREMDIFGLFESGSNLALLSLPVWLWALLPPNPACQYVGIIRSGNLLQPKESRPPQSSAIQVPEIPEPISGDSAAPRRPRSPSVSSTSTSRSATPPPPVRNYKDYIKPLPKKKRGFFSAPDPTVDEMTSYLDRNLPGRKGRAMMVSGLSTGVFGTKWGKPPRELSVFTKNTGKRTEVA